MATMTKRRGCESKRRHETKEQAQDQMFSMVRNGAALAGLNVYRCRHCGSYHVGHRPGVGRKR